MNTVNQWINFPELFNTFLYTLVGLTLMILCWVIIEMITPFSLRKSIEEDRNVAVAVLMSSVMLSLSILIAAVILS